MIAPLFSKKNDCRSCYKCIRHCPVKSISFQDNQAMILSSECIYCGTCYTVCPQGCKEVRSDIAKAKELIAKGNCYLSLAPSYLSSFPSTTFETMKEALLSLGFAGVEETAVGATIVKKAYDELVDQEAQDVLISTCCPSVVMFVKNKYPDLTKFLAPVLSPMQAHALDIKKRHPEASVVFVGPCISKKAEVDRYPGTTDCVLTFLELAQMFDERKIAPKTVENPRHDEATRARLFPTEGGILATMECRNPGYEYVSVSGMAALEDCLHDVATGKIHRVFLEASACQGSCINGPATPKKSALKTLLRVRSSAGKEDFPVEHYSLEELHKVMDPEEIRSRVFTVGEIEQVLRDMGKNSKKDELNCGSCGYSTCREKARAVLEGKASVSMCLPFLMGKTTSFTNDVIENSPNAIVVVDESLSIQLANNVFAQFLGFSSEELTGKTLSDYLDPTLFLDALDGHNCFGRHIELERYHIFVEATVRYDETYHIIIGTFRDRTQTVLDMRRRKADAEEAATVTREVIEKNMRAVQEIAELLGQSAAETKVALTRLSRVLSGGNDGKK